MLMPGIKSFVFDLENLNVYAFSYAPEMYTEFTAQLSWIDDRTCNSIQFPWLIIYSIFNLKAYLSALSTKMSRIIGPVHTLK